MSFLRILTAVLLSATAVSAADEPKPAASARPNILWLTSEDNGPQLGCYGDGYAVTPNLDTMARRGMRYQRCWSNAPVCAPARTALISGMYPSSTGSEHMRSMAPLPAGMRMYPAVLREAGYYCTNNSKEDYNLAKGAGVWDESSNKAHYKNRKPGQPFFAVFNTTVTHESQIRNKGGTPTHDPAKAPLPAYHPDTPEVRKNWAHYYDNLTTMDGIVGKHLAELDEAGLAEDTIVFYYGDHGSGMPRSKRTPVNSGLHVPLIVYFPPKFAHLAPKEYAAGGMSERLVEFVDLGPTVISLAGVKPPDYMQGVAFAGPHAGEAKPFIHGLRGRMDERIDLVRSVCDGRYVYVRNYMPHRPHGQKVAYQFETQTTKVWHDLFTQGKLTPQQASFWTAPRAPEELYDLKSDPWEVNNLAASTDAEHQSALKRLREAQAAQVMRVRDVGFLPEGEIHGRSVDATPYEIGHDDQKYPLQRIHDMAAKASMLKPDAAEDLKAGVKDPDSAVRYWAAMGLLMRGQAGYDAAKAELLEAAQKDASPFVRIPAAEAMVRFGDAEAAKQGLAVLLDLSNAQTHGVFSATSALNAIDLLGSKADPIRAPVTKLPRTGKGAPRTTEYVGRMIDHVSGKP